MVCKFFVSCSLIYSEGAFKPRAPSLRGLSAERLTSLVASFGDRNVSGGRSLILFCSLRMVCFVWLVLCLEGFLVLWVLLILCIFG